MARINHVGKYDGDRERLEGQKGMATSANQLVVIERNEGKGILCGLCVRTCEEVAGKGILGLIGRGFGTVVKPEFRDPATVAYCVNCLKCAQSCPTGAMKILK